MNFRLTELLEFIDDVVDEFGNAENEVTLFTNACNNGSGQTGN